jgi:hypothetical protein
MKIVHYICPRHSGKTTNARKFKEQDPENTLLIEAEGNLDFNFILNSLKIRGKNIKTVVIDEFLVSTHKNFDPFKFRENLNRLECKELFLYSTSDKLYNPIIFSLLYTNEVNVVRNTLHGYVNEEYKEKFINEVDEINNKFLNPHDVIVIKGGKTNIERSLMNHYEKVMMTKDFLLLQGEFLNLSINQ